MASNGAARDERARNPVGGMSAEAWLTLSSRAIEQTTTVVIITDVRGNIQYVNPEFTATTGYSLEEVIGKHINGVGRQSPEQEKRLWETLASGGDWRGEFHNKKKNGESYWLSTTISPIRSPDGVITHFLGCSEDITERKRAEEALRDSEEKRRSLLENIPDIVSTVDREGTILYMNRTLPGFTIEGVVGTSAYDYLSDEHRDRLAKALERVFAAGEVQQYESAGAGPYGSTSWYINRIGPILQDGKVVAATAVSTDITERKRAEEALRESEEKWRTLTENDPDFVVTVDREGTILATNRTVTDFSVAEVVGSTVYAYVPAEHHDSVRQALQAVFQTGDTARIEVTGVGPGGSTSWYDVRLEPVALDGRVAAAIWIATDVTDRRQAEDALRDSEARYRAIVDNIDEVVYLISVDDDPFAGSIQYVSRRIEETIGYGTDDFVRDPRLWARILHPDDKAAVTEATHQMFATGEARTREYRLRHKVTGSYVWLEDRVVPRVDEDGKVVAFLGVARDVTERKRAEEALRQSEQRFRSAFEHAATGMALVAPDGRLLRANRACCEALGYSEQEIASMTWRDITYPDDIDATLKQVRRVLAGEIESYQLEKRFIHKRGHVLWGHLTSSLVRDAEGRPVHFITQIQDITERKRAEQALRESEMRFRQLVDQAVDAICVADLEGNFVDANPAACDSLGYTREELLTMSVMDVADGLTVEMLARTTKRVVSGKPLTIETVHRRKDGSTFPVEIRVGLLDVGGRKHILGLARDVSERKRAEEALRESQERYRELVENINETIYELDAAGRITYVSPVAEEAGDYSLADLIGRPITDLVHPDDRERVHESVERSLHGHSEPIEFRIVSKSGEIRWHRSFARVATKDGKVVGLRGVLTDITEAKRAEEALREREETVLALLNAATETALLVETDGTILAINQIGAERLGGAVDEFVGLCVYDLMPPAVAATRKAKLAEVVASGRALRHEDARGGRLFDNTIYPIFDAEGNVARLAVFASDITGLRDMEKALTEAREELETKVESQMQRRGSAYGLTFRELTVLHLVAAGKPDKEIATLLVISPRTANKHVENILNKMGASSRTEAGVRAVREGLLD